MMDKLHYKDYYKVDSSFKVPMWIVARSRCNVICVNISFIPLPNVVRPSQILQPVQKSTRTVGISPSMWMN